VNWTDFIPSGNLWIVWLLQASLAVGVITLFAGGLIALLGKIPIVGPILAGQRNASYVQAILGKVGEYSELRV
jgi:hypothetical protein